MKILQLILNLYTGGAEKLIVELCNEFASGHEVILCTFNDNTNEMILPGMLDKRVKNISLHIYRKRSIRNILKLYHLVKETKPDIIHIHSSLVVINFIPLILLFRHIGLVHTVHSTLTVQYKKFFTFLNMIPHLRKRIFNICVSPSICTLFKGEFPALSFNTVANGIAPLNFTAKLPEVKDEFNTYRLTENTKLIISIGNFTLYKRTDILIDIMKYYKSPDSDLVLIFAGDYRDKINNIDLSKLPDNIKILGLKSNVADYLVNSDALIVASDTEGLPMVVLEALSLGKIVISTPAGGIIDLIRDGFTGFLADNFTRQALIDAINRFLSASPGQLEVIKQNARDLYSKHYKISHCADNYLELYNSILHK